ncbi:hypothetical protein TrVE_jg9584 [Triparma verrucosa]|uniref:RNA helicase n=1 Tax=Triparma verrucosa TaxID=1606542 RepID=A0A9W7EUK7_9STRA|nr:hypothetical protein TrVE_jg9584 [Triparma verrucosa]
MSRNSSSGDIIYDFIPQISRNSNALISPPSPPPSSSNPPKLQSHLQKKTQLARRKAQQDKLTNLDSLSTSLSSPPPLESSTPTMGNTTKPLHDFGETEEIQLRNETGKEEEDPVMARIIKCGQCLKKQKLILSSLSLKPAKLPTSKILDLYASTLHKLSLSNNPLYSLSPLTSFFASLKTLRTLDLSQCSLHSLPPSLSLPSLKLLDLSCNTLTSLNSLLSSTPNLTHLDLYSNNFQNFDFSEELSSQPTNLIHVNLGYNNLSLFPSSLPSSLKTLTLNNNLIKVIPSCLKGLKVLEMELNPVGCPPMEVVRRGVESIRRFYNVLEEENDVGTIVKSSKDPSELSGGVSRLFPMKEKKDRRKKKKKEAQPTRKAERSRSEPAQREKTTGRGKGTKRTTTKGTKSKQQVTTAKKGPPSPPLAAARSRSTLKLIFVGDSLSGKTSTILRLLHGTHFHPGTINRVNQTKNRFTIKWEDGTKSSDILQKHIQPVERDGKRIQGDELLKNDRVLARRDIPPSQANRTVGVSINTWNVNETVDFSVWDFAGQREYHSTHELYFTPGAVFVICYDLGCGTDKSCFNKLFLPEKVVKNDDESSDSSEEEDDEEDYNKKAKKSVEAFEQDVEEKVQFWIDCIQTSVPGAVILPVATFDDEYDDMKDGGAEAKRRTKIMMRHLKHIEAKRVKHLNDKLEQYRRDGELTRAKGKYLQKLKHSRPRIIFNDDPEDPVIRVSNKVDRNIQDWGPDRNSGFATLQKRMVELTEMEVNGRKLFPSVGSTIPSKWATIKKLVETQREERPYIEFSHFRSLLQKELGDEESATFTPKDLVDALQFFSDVGILIYFGNESTASTRRSHPDSSNDQIKRYFDFDEYDEERDRDTDDESTSTSSTSKEHIPSLASTASSGSTMPDKISRTSSSVGSTADIAQFIFLSPRWLMTACKGILRHDLKEKLMKLEKAKGERGKSTGGGIYNRHDCPVIRREEVLELWNDASEDDMKSKGLQDFKTWIKKNREIKDGGGGDPMSFLIRLLVTFNVFVPVDLTIKESILGGVKIGDLYTQDTAGKIDDSQYYFLPSQLRPYDTSVKNLFDFKLLAKEQQLYACLSHAFVLNEFCPPGVMHRVIAVLLREIHALPRFQKAGAWYSLVPASISVDSQRMCVYMNVVRDADKKNVNQVVTYVALHMKDDEMEIGAEDLKENVRLVVAAKGLKSENGSGIFLGGYELFLRVVANVLSEYSGLEYSREIFCPTCIQRKPPWEVKSFEKRHVMEALKEGAPFMTCSCEESHQVGIEFLLPEAAEVLAKKKSEMERTANLQQQEGLYGEALEGIVFLMVIMKIVEEDQVEGVEQTPPRMKSMGTGFIVNAKEGLIATAAHVVKPFVESPVLNQSFDEDDDDSIKQYQIVVGVVGKEQRKANFLYTATVNTYVPEIDVAILQIATKMRRQEGAGGGPLSTYHDLQNCEEVILHVSQVPGENLVQLAVEDDRKKLDHFQLGDPITMLGFPQYQKEAVNRDLYLSLTTGNVQKQVGRHPTEIQIDITNDSGSSGGPVLNADNKVIGIFSKSEEINIKTGYMVKASAWRELAVPPGENMGGEPNDLAGEVQGDGSSDIPLGGPPRGENKRSRRKGVPQVKKARFTQKVKPQTPLDSQIPDASASASAPATDAPPQPVARRVSKGARNQLGNVEIENIEKKMLARFGSSKIKNVKVATDEIAGKLKPKRDRLKHKPWEKKKKGSSNFETKFEKEMVVEDAVKFDGENEDDGEDPDEFYDEDDEGFEEILIEDEEADAIESELDAVLKPPPKRKDNVKRGGLFGRAIVDVEKEKEKENEMPRRGRVSEEYSDDEESSEPKKKKPAKPPTPEILVDARGQNLTLSLDVVTREMSYASEVVSPESDSDSESTPSPSPLPSPEFSNLGITHPQLLTNLASMKCSSALPSQLLSLPILLSKRDCLISTHTGSGKTLAFLIPLLQDLLTKSETDKTQSVKAVIVCPGRELASQITSVCRSVIQDTSLSVMMTIGGTAYAKNAEGLRKNKPTIVVGTPGRVAELMCGGEGRDKGVMKLSGVGWLVLDEFDNLLMSSAYKESTEAIYDSVVKARNSDVQCVMCSATARDMRVGQVERFLKGDYGEVDIGGYGRNMESKEETASLAAARRQDAVTAITRPLINVNNPMSQSSIHGFIKLPHKRLALELLRKILHTEPQPQQVLVFVNDKHRVDIVLDKMHEKGIVGAGLSGGSDKDDRTEVARALRSGNVGLVVSTEIAARGLDAPYLTHVVNLDLPSSSSHYCHRAGRVGRGGKPGVVVSLACGGKEGGVIPRFGRELGILVNEVDVRGGLMRIVKQEGNLE